MWGGGMINVNIMPRENLYILKLLDAACACAVNCFFVITGWFSSEKNKVNIRKPLHIIFIFCIYKAITYLISVVLGLSEFGCKHFLGTLLPNSYFALMYVSIIIISPFLNLINKNMSLKNFKTFILIILFLFGVYPSCSDFFCAKFGLNYMGMSNITIHGNSWGYNLVNFTMMYFLGSYLKVLNKNNNKIFSQNKIIDLIGYFICSMLIFLFSFVNPHSMHYCNIFVILQSLFLFMFFSKLEIKSPIINWCAKSVWGIYCIHLCIPFFWSLFDIPEKTLGSFAQMSGNLILSVVCVFSVSLLADKIYSIILFPLFKLVDKIKFFNQELKVE